MSISPVVHEALSGTLWVSSSILKMRKPRLRRRGHLPRVTQSVSDGAGAVSIALSTAPHVLGFPVELSFTFALPVLHRTKSPESRALPQRQQPGPPAFSPSCEAS